LSTVVEITGAIDVYTASAVGETIQSLITDGVTEIVLDLSGVTRLDSSGLGTLVGNAKAMASAGGAIWLSGLNYRIRRMLEVTNLAKYFGIQDEADNILAELEALELSHTPS
jgi:anti-sigma B factor antagonist